MRPWASLQDFETIRNRALAGGSPQTALVQMQASALPVMRVYYGPPGTGKTLAAVRAAVQLADRDWFMSTAAGAAGQSGNGEPAMFLERIFARFRELHGRIVFITFNPGDQYETIVEAIRPYLSGPAAVAERGEPSVGETAEAPTAAGAPEYHHWEGPVLTIIRRARSHPEEPHVLVIDEINRADISQVLGPLISAIEADKREGSPFPVPFRLRYAMTTEDHFVPANLHVIGTMNSADRNIALVDTALRRRFEFVRLTPRPGLLSMTKDDDSPIDAARLLERLNTRVRQLLGSDLEIGHSYFQGAHTNEELIRAFATGVLPLFEEYFYGDDLALLLVLGEHPDDAAHADRVFDITTSDPGSLESVFGTNVADAAAAQISGSTGRPVYRRHLRSQFWDLAADPPRPGNPLSAARALIKIYAPAEEVTPPVGHEPGEEDLGPNEETVEP